MRKLIGIIDCGMFSIRIWKEPNYPIMLNVILEYSHLKEEEHIPVYDLRKKLKCLEIRSIELYDSGVINTLLSDDPVGYVIENIML